MISKQHTGLAIAGSLVLGVAQSATAADPA